MSHPRSDIQHQPSGVFVLYPGGSRFEESAFERKGLLTESRAEWEERLRERPVGRVLFGLLWLNGMRFWGSLLLISLALLIFGDTVARIIGVVMFLPCLFGILGMFRSR
jgi:hypothetical protein